MLFVKLYLRLENTGLSIFPHFLLSVAGVEDVVGSRGGEGELFSFISFGFLVSFLE